MPYYLMRFDRETLAEPEIETFRDGDQAVACLNEAEIAAPEHVEVVLFHARSKSALRQTHSSYFSHSSPPRGQNSLPPHLAYLAEMPLEDLIPLLEADFERLLRQSQHDRKWLDEHQHRWDDEDDEDEA